MHLYKLTRVLEIIEETRGFAGASYGVRCNLEEMQGLIEELHAIESQKAGLSDLTVEQLRSKLWGLGAELSMTESSDTVEHIYAERDVIEAELARREFSEVAR